MFTWVKGNAGVLMLTLSSRSITMNAAAAAHFQDVRWVMIGIDADAKQLAIKPVTKQEIESRLVDLNALHKVSIGKGYGRISSKACMEALSELLKQDLDALKIEAVYDERENMLIADLSIPQSEEED